MAEISIAADEFFSFAHEKCDTLCRVKFCRNDRAPSRRVCYKHHMQLFRARNPTRATYNQAKSKAKQRGIPFRLTFDEFKSICEASGYIEGKGHGPSDLTLDRVDPNRGYVFDNIKVITMSENSSKGSYERWVTTKDGRRIRLYQIGATTEDIVEAEQESEEWEPPEWLNEPDHHVPTENEPF
jgi:hypothetical protein